MKNIYYEIWIDTITAFKKHNSGERNWKIIVFSITTMCNALNLFTIEAFLRAMGMKAFLFEITVFPLSMLNSFTGFVLKYALVFIGLNYVLIFRNNRYRLLEKKYKDRNGRLAAAYTIVSALLGYAVILLYGFNIGIKG